MVGRSRRRGALVAMLCAVAAGCSTPAAPPPSSATPEGLDPAMIAALRTDAGWRDSDVTGRLRLQAVAGEVEQRLRRELGERYAGTWMEKGAPVLAVGVTDPASADRVRAAGAEPVVVALSAARLAAFKAALDDRGVGAGSPVRGWYVDPAANQIVIRTAAGGGAAARDLARSADVPASAVRVETGGPVRLDAALQGGDTVYFRHADRRTASACQVGFALTGGTFLTAGHCVDRIDVVALDGRALGIVVARSVDPSRDWAVVLVTPPLTVQATVGNPAGGRLPVRGSSPAPVGGAVCHPSGTYGWACGTILARDYTWTGVDGAAHPGAVAATACSASGDSGGPWISGDQAQGVHIGHGSDIPGSCRPTDREVHSVFEPVDPLLRTTGLHLLTN